MIRISKATEDFLSRYVFEQMNISELTEDNLDEVVNFISCMYEDPLSYAISLGEKIDEDLLKLASNAITEMSREW